MGNVKITHEMEIYGCLKKLFYKLYGAKIICL